MNKAELDKRYGYSGKSQQWQYGFDVAYRDLKNKIDSLKAQLNKLDDGWVSVLVKEPPIDQTVLICWSDSPDVEPEKDYMTVDEDLNHYWANFHKDNPSHWMLLPEPPQEQNND